MIWRSKLPDVEIPAQSITEYVLSNASSLSEKAAFLDGSGRVVTYGALEKQIRAFAGGLRARGVGPGTTWALMAPNLPEYAVIFHGLAYAGACVTTLNPTYGPEEIAHQLKDSGAKALITVGLFLETAKKAAAAAGVSEIFVIGPGDATPFTSLFGEPLTSQVPVPLQEHVVVLPYSSGTTGFPKGVMLTHHNLVANLAQCRVHIPVSGDDICYAVLPFFHIYGMQVLMNFALSCGATLVTVPRFDLIQMLELVQTHKVSRLYLVPPIVLALAKHPAVEKYDLSSVKEIFSGAAPLDGELAEAAARRIGCRVAQGYGMTELSPVCHAIFSGEYKPSSVGCLLPNTEARLVDPTTNQDTAEGQPGELWIRGPQRMLGYLNNPEATAQTIDAEGWLHTGDIAKIDADGHTFIVDRLKELIKYKGFQVAPAELEAVLLGNPQIADAAVIGIPDQEAGELPMAFVVRAQSSQISEQEVIDFAAQHLSTYKRLHKVEFISAIPKSASGKILRRELRALQPK
jgi:acyl-CoA synthetase (AMP-forming)/AMP-acid ligase II